jgi:hypothetical protein
MAELREFLSELATNPSRLGEFIQDPEAAMTAAELSDEDKTALQSGFPAMIYARLMGVPAEQAFTIRAPIAPPQIAQVAPQIVPLQLPPQLPPQIVWPVLPPQIVWPVIPPQLPPQIVWPVIPPQLPPQIVWPVVSPQISPR